MQAAVAQIGSDSAQQLAGLADICRALDLEQPTMLRKPDLAHAPLLVFVKEKGWGVIAERTPQGQWLLVQEGGVQVLAGLGAGDLCLRLGKAVATTAADGPGKPMAMIRKIIGSYRGVLAEGVLATIFMNLLALAGSLFSMQVYDRVIPTRGESTLVVLGVGVLLVIFIETALKFARSRIMESVVIGLDGGLSREIFQRLLSVRIDQMPGSVGTLAGQLRGYEQVRSFLTARTMFALVDVPMAVIYLVIIAVIGSPLIAGVPLLVALIAIAMGLIARRRLEQMATQSAQAANHRTGLLVEAVDGAETIKAGAGGWKFLSRWLDLAGQTLRNDLRMQHASEGLAYWGSALQQISYCAVVAIGAIEAIGGHITGGAVMACSILGGRVLGPVLALPGLMVQHAHATAAMKGLDQLYALETDHHGVTSPLAPSDLRGQFDLADVSFAYPESGQGIHVSQLRIQQGERVAVLGTIGSGKSTLLRVLAGLYRPQKGRVIIDGLDMGQINRQVLSQQIGYLAQDHRLFQGTLRENLLIGLPDPGDDVIHRALVRSGLIQLVSSHPRGLELPIREGGTGLSGGQRQLVAFTRLLLVQPNILLLDEPTASMDERQEQRCLGVLAEELESARTLIVVTHKPSVLTLVSRLVVVSGSKIVLDGPRDEVLARLAQRPSPAAEGPSSAEPAAAQPSTIEPPTAANGVASINAAAIAPLRSGPRVIVRQQINGVAS
ncbi:ATP-binding cassette domain-containing protein [Variovorax humicola]|uniref:ATP-binding cassette domain-containing protein n=1 Tax=Variovorax humicola TaxID=1769758 RepID=A0ABU8VY16_9BURK